jgi:CHAT domain-containing protein/tetratricopeptide (TPR) repeat protein
LADIDRGRYTDAEPVFRQALAVRRNTLGPDAPPVAQSLYNLGYLYRLEGRYDEAEPLLRHSLAIRETAPGPNDPIFAKNLNELGYLYQLQGRYADAEPMFRRALAIQETTLKPNDPAMADSLVNLGYLSRTTGHNSEAEQFYRRSISIRQDNPNERVDLARDLDNLGNLYRLEGRMSDAEPLEKQALEIRENVLGGNHPEVADSETDLASLYLAQRRYREAEQAFMRGLSIREAALGTDHPDVATKSLNGLVELFEAEGRPDAALNASNRAVDILQQHLTESAAQRSGAAVSERRLYRDEMLENIALLYTVQRDAPTGETVDRSFRVAQLAAASTAGEAVAGMAARFATKSDPLAAAIRELQDVAERRAQLDAALIRQASKPPSTQSATDNAELRSDLETAEQRLRTLERRIADEFPAYSDLTSAAPLSVATVQRLLAPDEAMLVYLIGERESWVWAVRQDRAAQFHIHIGAQSLSAEVAALRAKLDPWQNPSVQPFPATRAYRLYQTIAAPAQSLLDGAARIIIVPDGALESLPLGVLVTTPPRSDPVSPADHRSVAWFARDHALTVLPTVGSIQSLRRFASPSHATLPFLGIGDPALGGQGAVGRSAQPPGVLSAQMAPPIPTRSLPLFRDGVVNVDAVKELPSLPETAGELRTIQHVLGASDSDLYLGARASEPQIFRAPLNSYKVIEFATHGLMSGDLGLIEPALVLTPPAVATPDNDGLLTASKIAALKLDADWVVLSACNTASSDGTPDAGGLSGLAKAFFYAGARSMLVSHWSVNSLATVKLTTGAFAALARNPGIGRAEALRQSMMAMLDPSNPPELSHPLAWAPFVLAGEGGAGR